MAAAWRGCLGRDGSVLATARNCRQAQPAGDRKLPGKVCRQVSGVPAEYLLPRHRRAHAGLPVADRLLSQCREEAS